MLRRFPNSLTAYTINILHQHTQERERERESENHFHLLPSTAATSKSSSPRGSHTYTMHPPIISTHATTAPETCSLEYSLCLGHAVVNFINRSAAYCGCCFDLIEDTMWRIGRAEVSPITNLYLPIPKSALFLLWPSLLSSLCRLDFWREHGLCGRNSQQPDAYLDHVRTILGMGGQTLSFSGRRYFPPKSHTSKHTQNPAISYISPTITMAAAATPLRSPSNHITDE